MNQINNLSKKMNLQFNRNVFGEFGIKSRELGNLLKEKLINYICKVINEESQPEGNENGILQEELVQPQQLYKCFVGKGNNSILIRTLFKTRYWWLLHDKEELERVNLMWT
mmetsp:Transcript_33812/g.32895  ORF Transcript_33812/g.32895 Transcript_33812/m.32895 type:complete len:111 (-) Transcript_33812:1199-1531(-)